MDWLKRFKDVGALIENRHLVYTSGRHGSSYLNKDAVYVRPALTSEMAKAIAERIVELKPDGIVAPAVGAIILGHWVAFHLKGLSGKEVFSAYAEKTPEGGFTFKRGYGKLLANQRIVVVEDIVTTGGSLLKVLELIKSTSAHLVGAIALANRGGITEKDLKIAPFLSLMQINLPSWAANECPLCAQGITIDKDLGKG